MLAPVYSQDGEVADFRLDMVNPAGLRFLGKSRREVVGKLVRRQLRAAFDAGVLALAERVVGDGAAIDEEQRCGFAGEEGWCRVAVARVGGGVAVAISDITGRKGQEEAIQDLLRRLQRSNDELQTFAYAVSHDLQEPLRMVSSYLKLLVRRHAEDVSPEAREFIDFAVDGAERMHKQIQDLLTYSRVTTQGHDPEEVDMNRVVDDVRRNLSVAIEETGAVVETAHSLPVVEADPSQMVSLLQNLVGNAIKYRAPDRTPRVVVAAREEDGQTVFSVADNGIGIEDKYFERIFQVFQRLHKRDDISGTGIGLAVARRIVDRHGGRIWVESTPGEGSTYVFTLGRMMDASDPTA